MSSAHLPALPWPDDRLWVKLAAGWTPDPELRWRIHGNAHTHRGHFHVCAIGADLHRTVSKGDLADASPEARLWLDGFLRGQEASTFEFMGRSVDLDNAMGPADEARWRDWNDDFRARGYAPALNDMPPAELDLAGLGDPRPWIYIGGRYWIWVAGRWTVAEPQPATDLDPPGWAWPASICETRQHHELAVIGPVTVCEDCHEVSV